MSTVSEAFDGSEIHLFGTSFAIQGVTIDGLQIGVPIEIEQRDVMLSGSLANLSEFSFYLRSKYGYFPYLPRDYFDENALLTVTLVHNPGDYNGDGHVDDEDYLVWQAAMLTGDLAADGNYDRLVSQEDYSVWKQRFGTIYVAPEPTSLFLLLSIAVTFITAAPRSPRKPGFVAFPGSSLTCAYEMPPLRGLFRPAGEDFIRLVFRGLAHPGYVMSPLLRLGLSSASGVRAVWSDP